MRNTGALEILLIFLPLLIPAGMIAIVVLFIRSYVRRSVRIGVDEATRDRHK